MSDEIFFQAFKRLPFGFFYPGFDKYESKKTNDCVQIKRPIGSQYFCQYREGKHQYKIGYP